VVAERLTCAYSYAFEDDTQITIFERVNNNFIWKTEGNKQFEILILYENDKVLILGEMFNYDNYDSGTAFFTFFYDKVSKQFRSGTLPHPLNEKMKVPEQWIDGKCLVN
jgi:hypothetical protein